MESLFWQLANRTAETQFIFNLFHLLLAGLTLLVWLHQLRVARGAATAAPPLVLPLGFFLLVLHFGFLTHHFGVQFFLHKEFKWEGFESLSRGLLACGLLLVVSALLDARRDQANHWGRWPQHGCALVAGLVLIDGLIPRWRVPLGAPAHSAVVLAIDAVALLVVVLGMRAASQGKEAGWRANLVALALVGASLLLHNASIFLPRPTGIFLWNTEQHALSVALFSFAWAAGERSRHLLDRTFVRLNLTFIILASLIMLITVGMEKYQYLRLAEERSMNLAEFLRGHVIYYRERGENLEEIFRHPEVLRRVVVEFGTLPELRAVNVYMDGRRAGFHYADWEIREEIVSLSGKDAPETSTEIPNSFQMIRLPLAAAPASQDRVELFGTMDYINSYLGKYIILIYSLFTIMVALASSIVGIIVNGAERQIRQQYTELQETHQQLAQAAKLASVGELAGGMAHELNTPITSILSLASHLEKSRATSFAPSERESVEIIAQQAERVSRIVGNLLKFARQSHLEVSQLDVGELLDTATGLVQFRLRKNGIVVRREIDAELPLILGDATRLTEVFVNLLNNAIDAMPGGGVLVVRASHNPAREGGVRAEVTDSGCGIAPEHLPRIFDPFFTTKEAGRGTGLGLSISHGIVKDHGGHIWAESRLGTGTTLRVTLPTGGERR